MLEQGALPDALRDKSMHMALTVQYMDAWVDN